MVNVTPNFNTFIYNKIFYFLIIIFTSLFFECRTLKTNHSDKISQHYQIKEFLNYFYFSDANVKLIKTENFSLQNYSSLGSFPIIDLCSLNKKCNEYKTYSIIFTPNFSIKKIKGISSISIESPDSFVDLIDIKNNLYYRMRQTGTEGMIYSTFWLSEMAFVVFGIESGKCFIEIFDLNENIKIYYTVNNSKIKPNANHNFYLINKYSHKD